MRDRARQRSGRIRGHTTGIAHLGYLPKLTSCREADLGLPPERGAEESGAGGGAGCVGAVGVAGGGAVVFVLAARRRDRRQRRRSRRRTSKRGIWLGWAGELDSHTNGPVSYVLRTMDWPKVSPV
jgi:hypothetical protein